MNALTAERALNSDKSKAARRTTYICAANVGSAIGSRPIFERSEAGAGPATSAVHDGQDGNLIALDAIWYDVGCAGHDQLTSSGDTARTASLGEIRQASDRLPDAGSDGAGGERVIEGDIGTHLVKVAQRDHIKAGLQAADAGDFASDEEVAAAFARF